MRNNPALSPWRQRPNNSDDPQSKLLRPILEQLGLVFHGDLQSSINNHQSTIRPRLSVIDVTFYLRLSVLGSG
jgi:hypothetical protein